MADRVSDWHAELGQWLEPFLTRLGHKATADVPLYIAGLIGRSAPAQAFRCRGKNLCESYMP